MYYQINRETQKLELIFDKAEYLALPEESKAEIKSAFLFSRKAGGWVSRAKSPNTWRAEAIAKNLGAENRGKTGESLTFAEQMERKAQRAEDRAERMEDRAAAAQERGKALQKPIESRRGDIAFFTQPNINTSSGRAFSRQRERMFAAYDRGMEEFKKSAYYAQRAQTARETAAGTKPNDKGFCERRIAEAQKSIRAQRKNLESYRGTLEKIESGEEVKSWSGKLLTAEDVREWMDHAEEASEAAMQKEIYYTECLDDLGGVQFSRDNIKPGYIVEISRYKGPQVVVSTGPKNFVYQDAVRKDLFSLKASYGEIVRVIRAEEKKPEMHPFTIGDSFQARIWTGADLETHDFEIVKATEKTVTIQDKQTGKKYVRKPQKRRGACYEGGEAWAVYVTDNYNSGFFKRVEA